MIRENAPAKINLALHVRRRRADGYHDLETLFAFAQDGDVVTVEEAEVDRFTITGPFAGVLQSSPERGGGPFAQRRVEGQPQATNLVVQAAIAFTRAFAIDSFHAIALDKRLPIASGIGGGSADAAATLRALARLHAIPLDDPRLQAIAAGLGADVPACLLGRTTIGTGKGDSLVEIAGLPGTPLLLVNSGVAVSTPAVFKGWDGEDRGPIPDGDLLARAASGRNDLEPPARAIAPVIAEVRAVLDAGEGVVLARMSGSGATCFALFDTVANRAATAAIARKRGWWCLETVLA